MVSRAVDVVNIDICWGIDVVTEFITLVAHYKGLRTEYASLESDAAPAILFQNVQVEGLWPATNFIKEARPYPEISPDSVPKRAIIRSLTERVLYRPQVLSLLHDHYKKHGAAHAPTLIDFAIAARASNRWTVQHHPWILQIAQTCERHIAGRWL